jgi:polyisoprenoid-binding protein YceI
VRCAINGNAESVEVGVHRGLQVDGVVRTADFGLSVQNPIATAIAVESII